MTTEQVFGKLNKDIKGLTSGVASASVSGSSIIFTMNDGSIQTITFPQPKDGASIVAVSTNENNQFVFSMSDGTEIVGGEVPASSGVSKEYVDSELSKKANNSDIPTKVSGLQNDSNYQTDTDVATALTPYAKSADVTKEITNKVAEIIADAPEDFNTLKEMSDWISNHEDDASAMNSAISDNKTSITALQTGKADKSEIPTTLPANGGNADTVNNHTVESDVPVDAKFTDTVYDDTKIKEDINKQNESLSVIGKCKNLLNPTLQTTTQNGVTCTNNGDGTYTFTGTATGTATFIVKDMVDFVKNHINKDIRLVGCPKNGGVGNKYRLQFWGEPNSTVYDVGNGGNIHFKNITENANIAIIIDTGITATNLVFKPMLTTNLSATYDDFVPYTGDGETLVTDVAEIKNDILFLSDHFQPMSRGYDTVPTKENFLLGEGTGIYFVFYSFGTSSYTVDLVIMDTDGVRIVSQNPSANIAYWKLENNLYLTNNTSGDIRVARTRIL